MARKSKRMALYEAIRQGQVNIARGLESGKLRSDGVPKESPKPPVPDNTALLRSKEKRFGVAVPFRVWAIAAGAAGFLVLLLLVGLIFSSDDDVTVPDQSPTVSQTPPQSPVTQGQPEPVEKEESSGFLGLGRNKKPKPQPRPETTTVTPPPSTGDNVIVIQGISASRKDELDAVRDYFLAKGIQTEIMIDRSGYALLATQQGFEKNPENSGTAGYKLLQKIRQLGQQYPGQTGDTKFGQKPFQDAYGYKR